MPARRSQRFLHIGVHEASPQPAALIGCILQNIVLTVIVEPVLTDVLKIFALPFIEVVAELILNREIILVEGTGAINIKRELPDLHLAVEVLRRNLQAHGDPGVFFQKAGIGIINVITGCLINTINRIQPLQRRHEIG